MAEISRTALFGKLNSLAYKSVESATVFCKMRGQSLCGTGTLAKHGSAVAEFGSSSYC